MRSRKVNKVLESVRQADEILRGSRARSRKFHVDTASNNALLRAIRNDPKHVLPAISS
jgi:hypothetical protein